MSYYIKYLTHSGIKGQKWGIRRFRNYDDTLTPAGKERYGSKTGGGKTIKQLERARRKREKILSDPEKLYKHRSEFTEDEIRKANEKFTEAQKTKLLITEAKQREMQAKLEKIRQSTEWQKEKASMARAKQEAKYQAAKNKQSLKAQKARDKREAIKAEKEAKNSVWPSRAKKYKGVWDFGKQLKNITDDMGWTKADTGESIYGWISSALGMKKYKNPPKGDGNGKKKKKKGQQDDDDDD